MKTPEWLGDYKLVEVGLGHAVWSPASWVTGIPGPVQDPNDLFIEIFYLDHSSSLYARPSWRVTRAVREDWQQALPPMVNVQSTLADALTLARMWADTVHIHNPSEA